jgi:hypothetical protein
MTPFCMVRKTLEGAFVVCHEFLLFVSNSFCFVYFKQIWLFSTFAIKIFIQFSLTRCLMSTQIQLLHLDNGTEKHRVRAQLICIEVLHAVQSGNDSDNELDVD